MTFRDLGLIAPILRALDDQGYSRPSPIQEKAIPPALDGRDVLGCAQTGTGKTCAFAAPILQRLNAAPAPGRPIRALILTPTRELAIQIGESFDAYGKNLPLRCTVIFGGVGQGPQVEALKRGVDILVATPGRLGDLYQQKLLDLSSVEILVLDEADRMLDMGFIHDVRKILKWLPEQKQTMLFSATMPPEITDLVNSLLRRPVRVAVDPVSSPVEAIRQHVCFVDKANKTKLIAYLMEKLRVKNALVFTRTKHGANKVARDLAKEGISAAAIHGNKSQTARQQALADFKAGRVRCLVATDIAARGLDIEELSHVFNYNLPEVPETYVHRIGRTGRAGRGGEAVSLCDFGEKPLLKDIEKLIGRSVPVLEDHPYPMQVFEAPKRDKNGKVINEEDAEARAAARELKRARDEARQAAAKEKRQAEERSAQRALQVLQAQPAEEPPEKKRRRRKKKKSAEAAQEAPAPALSPELELEEDYVPSDRYAAYSGRPRMTRPGSLLDTGDAMPETEFQRPDPFAGDFIMDATARLLAPRKLTLTPEPPRRERREDRKKRGETRPVREKPQAAPPPEPEVSAPTKSKKRRHQHKGAQKAAEPAPGPVRQSAPEPPRDEPKKAGSKKRRSRRAAAQEPRRPQMKDSTEQKSLMKPFYLDL